MAFIGTIPGSRRAQDSAFRFRSGGSWTRITWGQFDLHVGSAVAMLKAAGLKKGERIALALNTSYAFAILDLAATSLGVVTVPMHPSASTDERVSILRRTTPRIILVQSGLLSWEQAAAAAEISSPVWAVDDPSLPQDQLLRRLQNHAPVSWRLDTEEDQLLTIVFTSGTTGEPRGVKVTAGMARSMCEGAVSMLPVQQDDSLYLFLPLAHIFGRIFLWVQQRAGYEVILAPDYDRIQLDLQETQPTVLAAVPRLLEKIFDQLGLAMRNRSGLGELAMDVAEKLAVTKGRKQRVTFPLLYAVSHQIANKLVFKRVRDAFGGNLRFIISGGAPLEPNLAAFYIGAGVPVVQGYGMTETTGVVFVNRLDDNDPNTVGHSIAGLEYRFGPEDELWLRGPMVATGLWKDRTVLVDDDGWLHTGDCGQLDPHGRLRITGRIKELLVLANGKNVAPVPVEAKIMASPFIERVILIGDNLPYITALVAVNHDELLRHLGESTLPNFTNDKRILTIIEREIERINKRLSSYESIKTFRILPGSMSVQGGELTSTLKPRRKVIFTKYKDLIASMYPETPDDSSAFAGNMTAMQ